LKKQLLPSSFEYAVHQLLDHEFDLSLFDGHYRNDQRGARAYPPGRHGTLFWRRYCHYYDE
jgi:hypothetical protein